MTGQGGPANPGFTPESRTRPEVPAFGPAPETLELLDFGYPPPEGLFMMFTLVVFAAYGVSVAAVRVHIVSRPHVMTWLRRGIPLS